MVTLWAVCYSSALLLNWVRAHSGGSRLDLGGLVRLATEELEGPNLALLDHFLVFHVDLEDLIVVSASEEGSLVLEDLKTPSFSIVMRYVDELLVGAIDVDCLDSTVVVTDQNLSIQDVKG